jgi:hypothetical protein
VTNYWQEWCTLVQKYRDRGLSVSQAIIAANKENPELRRRAIVEWNQEHGTLRGVRQ